MFLLSHISRQNNVLLFFGEEETDAGVPVSLQQMLDSVMALPAEAR